MERRAEWRDGGATCGLSGRCLIKTGVRRRGQTHSRYGAGFNGGMDGGSFAGYLGGLGKKGLAELLRKRPDVRVPPVPRGFEQLAQRLGGPDSLAWALWQINRDELIVGEAIAALSPGATVSGVARLLGADKRAVKKLVADLCGRGLAWTVGEEVRLPERLALHWSVAVGGGRPVAKIAGRAYADDLRTTAAALGIDVEGLRKPELIERLSEVLSDTPAIAEIVAGLPEEARERLDQLRHGASSWSFGISRYGADMDLMIAAAGLTLRVNHQAELPREVSVAAWLMERRSFLDGARSLVTGPPEIPAAATTPAEVAGTAQAAIQDVLRAVIGVLDTAQATPISALKKGGIGARVRSRLAAQLSLSDDMLSLAIDVAHDAGLLARADSGYVPTEEFSAWRDAEPVCQWVALVASWRGLEFAPTYRVIDEDGKELPPPLSMASDAGMIRRALLRASDGGRSVKAAREHIDWFCPIRGGESDSAREECDAAVREAEMLGVIAANVLTECGREFLVVAESGQEELGDGLVKRLAPLFPERHCSVVLQSDLTAVVSGQPSAWAADLLSAAAHCEKHGLASTWRFSPDSVRNALDSGWTAEGLLEDLATLSEKKLPQPLRYLVNDAGRKHGQIKVRGMRSAILADEPTVTELLHTRRLAKLQFGQLAPTVLSSPSEPDDVVTQLRTAGFSPMVEDATGSVVIKEHRENAAPSASRGAPEASRDRLDAAELAKRLLADPRGEEFDEAVASDTFFALVELAGHMTEAEVALLADALDHQRDVSIVYRDKKGNRTQREIRPTELDGRWLVSWCHLRNGEREFTVGNIESVAPAMTARKG